MRLDRLKYLAREVLPYVEERRYNMKRWANKCGTASCAMGYMCVSPRGVRDGLELLRDDDSCSKRLVPCFGRRGLTMIHDLDAVAAYFDLPDDIAVWLFVEDDDTGSWWRETPAETACRIEDVIAAWE